MSKETLLQLVERLREAGQRYHDYTYINMVAGVKLCPAAPGGEAGAPCMCGANEHNKKCDAAAKSLVAKIERVEAKSKARRDWVVAAMETVEACPEENCEHCAAIMPLYNENSDTILED